MTATSLGQQRGGAMNTNSTNMLTQNSAINPKKRKRGEFEAFILS
jgi:hypothetical protein